ncbi:alpha/beta fold hydrolase [Mycobacterium montefiorense]|uniref:Hydrolase n=1 Tax=Mycobacterium montefiorense TaxID=154654 RepID=A0AA37UUZ8_9MYCO|nr:alpha/beta fold hydrolase [Mycobacterium montefiorense]GBG38906.1 hydrolase [Mycobacterium montefiorense]GKU32694.1 hydrolase [Mycobacterium montefiorense]GKU38216.1 hydrolase [Mycobacterium montefiorense]GKU43504.1 hydrolase [Mycobacterium montefiorense]GKU50245.1 hydrolase [Mycobacterium montefiorense]
MESIKSINVKGRHTRVFVAGDVDHPPILLLHGIGRSIEDWETQFVPLRQAGYRVIAPDLPGSGFSDRLPTYTTLPGLAQGVLETVDAIGETRRLHVIGHSLGGAVALQLLALHPDRVATLNLVSSGGFGSALHPILRLAATPLIGAVATRHTNRATARMTERQIYVDRSFATDERIDRAVTLARRPDTGAVMHETARSVATIRGVRPQWRAELISVVSKHRRPTLIIWGDHDRFLPGRQIDASRRLFPHARVHLLRAVGHAPQVEAAERFAELTLDFLRSQPAATAAVPRNATGS